MTGLQLIDGELTGADAVSGDAWVVVRAVDGAWWDVLSTDAALLDAVAQRFADAAPLPR